MFEDLWFPKLPIQSIWKSRDGGVAIEMGKGSKYFWIGAVVLGIWLSEDGTMEVPLEWFPRFWLSLAPLCFALLWFPRITEYIHAQGTYFVESTRMIPQWRIVSNLRNLRICSKSEIIFRRHVISYPVSHSLLSVEPAIPLIKEFVNFVWITQNFVES